MSANTLAKIVNGICDNTLTLVVRCWDFLAKTEDGKLKNRIIVCPAMNTMMYENPITGKQIKVLKEEMGIDVIDPIEKILVCGEKGIGAMAEVDRIVEIALEISKEVEKRK